MRKLLLLSTAGCALVACAPTATVATNFSPSALEQEPSIKVEVALDATMPTLKTFTVIPVSQVSDQGQATGITAQHLAFQARNYMELLGYRFVENREDADLDVFVDGSSKYSEVYVPPSQYTMPKYVPGTTATYNSTTTGSYSGGLGWGNYIGNTTGSVSVPGYYTSQTYTSPGYTKGAYYPAVSAFIYDTKTKKQQVSGVAVGTSRNEDVRISGQILMYRMFAQMPLANQPNVYRRSGMMGISVAPWTTDGNAYYPIVIDITKESAAARAGLIVGDLILGIDGQPTANKPMVDIDKLIAEEAGKARTLIIFRAGETKTIKLVMAPRE